MNLVDMMKAIRQELSVTDEDITIDHSSTKTYEESEKRFEEFKKLVQQIGKLARAKRQSKDWR